MKFSFLSKLENMLSLVTSFKEKFKQIFYFLNLQYFSLQDGALVAVKYLAATKKINFF